MNKMTLGCIAMPLCVAATGCSVDAPTEHGSEPLTETNTTLDKTDPLQHTTLDDVDKMPLSDPAEGTSGTCAPWKVFDDDGGVRIVGYDENGNECVYDDSNVGGHVVGSGLADALDAVPPDQVLQIVIGVNDWIEEGDVPSYVVAAWSDGETNHVTINGKPATEDDILAMLEEQQRYIDERSAKRSELRAELYAELARREGWVVTQAEINRFANAHEPIRRDMIAGDILRFIEDNSDIVAYVDLYYEPQNE